LEPIQDIAGWTTDEDTVDPIDRMLADTITDPVGPEFMAPPGGVTT
jgi:hypothetical protein